MAKNDWKKQWPTQYYTEKVEHYEPRKGEAAFAVITCTYEYLGTLYIKFSEPAQYLYNWFVTWFS